MSYIICYSNQIWNGYTEHTSDTKGTQILHIKMKYQIQYELAMLPILKYPHIRDHMIHDHEKHQNDQHSTVCSQFQ